MSYSVVRRASRRPIHGLGAVTVPWQCWDVVDFKACQDKAAGWAFSACQANSGFVVGSPSFNNCVSEQTDVAVKQCIDKNCSQFTVQAAAPKSVATVSAPDLSPPVGLKALPLSTYSTVTVETQIKLNQVLPLIGKQKVTVDGKLGAGTCQAIRDVIKSGKVTGWVVPDSCPSVSSSGGGSVIPGGGGGGSVIPGGGGSVVPGGGGSPSTVYVQDPNSMNKWLLIGAGVLGVAGIGIFIAARRKKKKGNG